MSDVGKRDVERLLRAHYRAERGAPDEMSKAAALAAVRAAVASEQRSSASAEAAAGATVGERSREATFAGFVAAQARFIHPRVWVAQLALVAVMAVLCLPSSGMAHGIPVVSGMLAAATVLVGLPELLASAAHETQERLLRHVRRVVVERSMPPAVRQHVVVMLFDQAIERLAVSQPVLQAPLHLLYPL